MRRRKDDFLPEVPKEVLGVGSGGGESIPYDRSNEAPELGGAMGAGLPPGDAPAEGMPGTAIPDPNTAPTLGLAQLGLGEAGADPSMMGLPEMPGSTDQMSDIGLAEDPTELLSDPSLTPEQRAALEQEIMMAARRNFELA